jgi:hypothetical protein
LRTFRAFAKRDLLNQAALGRMWPGFPCASTQSAWSRSGRSIGHVEIRQLAALQRGYPSASWPSCSWRDLSQLNLVAMFIDGVEIAEHCIVAAVGIDADGRKHPLGALG